MNYLFDEEYAAFEVSIWTVDDSIYTRDEILTTHRCNQTDRNYFAPNSRLTNIKDFEQNLP